MILLSLASRLDQASLRDVRGFLARSRGLKRHGYCCEVAPRPERGRTGGWGHDPSLAGFQARSSVAPRREGFPGPVPWAEAPRLPSRGRSATGTGPKPGGGAMILLSLASRQIWPHILAVAWLKPTRIFLLHTRDVEESQGPAQRLKRFFDETELVPRGGTRLEPVSHNDFTSIERSLDTLQTKHQLPLSDCRLNFTGGNKLMATAAFRWAARRSVSAFYLERGNQLVWFEPRDGEMLTCSETWTGRVTNDFIRSRCSAVTLMPRRFNAPAKRSRSMPTVGIWRMGSSLAPPERQ